MTLYMTSPITRIIKTLLILSLILFVASCGLRKKPSKAPRNIENACSIVKQKRDWHKDLKAAKRKWKVPVHVIMATIYQESKFEGRARPPKNKRGKRPSSAYGYSQALDATWKWYQREQKRGRAKRDDFGDSVDFIGWYMNKSYKSNGIRRKNAYKQYLAYHEGHTGYKNKTYRKKKWLIKVARSVQERAIIYKKQLRRC